MVLPLTGHKQRVVESLDVVKRLVLRSREKELHGFDLFSSRRSAYLSERERERERESSCLIQSHLSASIIT